MAHFDSLTEGEKYVLAKKRMSPDQTLESFLPEFYSIVNKCGVEGEPQLIKAFTDSLPEHIGLRVVEKKFTTLQDAINHARKVSKKIQPPSALESKIDKILLNQAQSQKRAKAEVSSVIKKCTYCDGNNHTVNDCYARKRAEGSSNQQQRDQDGRRKNQQTNGGFRQDRGMPWNSGRGYNKYQQNDQGMSRRQYNGQNMRNDGYQRRSQSECFRCGKLGHFARECRVNLNNQTGYRQPYVRQGTQQQPAGRVYDGRYRPQGQVNMVEQGYWVPATAGYYQTQPPPQDQVVASVQAQQPVEAIYTDSLN